MLDLLTVCTLYKHDGCVVSTCLLPVGVIAQGESCVVARVDSFHCIFPYATFHEVVSNRSHTCPRTAQSLHSLALDGVQGYILTFLILGFGNHLGVVPSLHPVGEVLRRTAASPSVAGATISILLVLVVISIEHDFSVAVVGCHVHIVECLLQLIRSRVVDGLHCHVVSLLEVVVGLACIARALGIGGNLVRVLQPPSVGQIGLREIQACQVLRGSASLTRFLGQVGNSLLQISEDGSIDLGNGVTHRSTNL